MDKIVTHKDHDNYSAEVKRVRDGVGDGVIVKRAGKLYLPHPSALDTGSPEAIERYGAYKLNAEWDAFPQKTLRTMIGTAKFQEAKVELDQKIQYLESDIDGNGLSMRGAFGQVAANILAAKWHVLLADYHGLPSVNLADLSIEEAAKFNTRSTIKQYSRENVMDWHFSRINGRMQLTYILLLEIGTSVNEDTREKEVVESYLELGIDDTGYYQCKIVKNKDGLVRGDKKHVTIKSKNLDFIPLEIVTDGEIEAGSLPTLLGFMKALTDLCYSRYAISAEYKEAIRNLPPTIFTSGWTEAGLELFEKANGREFIATGSGATNSMPKDVTQDIISAATELGGYERYFDDNARKIRALGGDFDDGKKVQKTAAEANIEESQRTAALIDTINGVESAFRNVVAYCGMFELIYSVDTIQRQSGSIDIELDRGFMATKISAEEAAQIQAMYINAIISKEQAIAQLVNGGWLNGDASSILLNQEG